LAGYEKCGNTTSKIPLVRYSESISRKRHFGTAYNFCTIFERDCLRGSDILTRSGRCGHYY